MLDRTKLIFECARPTEVHGRICYQWRNDPTVRAVSRDSSEKTWEQFFPLYCRKWFGYSDLPMLFIVYDGKRVGYLRFEPCQDPYDPKRRCCEVSIVIAKEERGKGLATLALDEGNKWAKERGYFALFAEVKVGNRPSHKLFEAAGYKKIGERQHAKEHYFQYHLALTDKWKESPVFIIAEAGSNWRAGSSSEDRKRARRLIEVAKEAGADAVKFQVFRPETVYAAGAGQAEYLTNAGISGDIHALFADLAMPYEMIPELAEYAKEVGIEWMASPFSLKDFAAVDPHVQRHKIASYEITHLRLIEVCARAKKPTFLSTGGATIEEIDWAVGTFYKAGGRALTLLQCVAQYPADISRLNLRVIPWLKERYGTEVGLSDHSADPTLAPAVAVGLGAKVIEKHFTTDRGLPGPDHRFAVDPKGLFAMVKSIREAEEALGSLAKSVEPVEEPLRRFAHRRVQAICDIKKGERFLEEKTVAILRPGEQPQGVHPKYLPEMEGKEALREIPKGAGVKIGDWIDG